MLTPVPSPLIHRNSLQQDLSWEQMEAVSKLEFLTQAVSSLNLCLSWRVLSDVITEALLQQFPSL